MVQKKTPISDRWRRCTRALKRDDQQYGRRLLEILELNRDRNLPGIDDPLEAAIFLALVELLKELDGGRASLARSSFESTDKFQQPASQWLGGIFCCEGVPLKFMGIPAFNYVRFYKDSGEFITRTIVLKSSSMSIRWCGFRSAEAGW